MSAPAPRTHSDPLRTPSAALRAGLIALVVVSALVGLAVGRGGVLGFADTLLLRMRAERVAVAFLCGAAISVSGAVVQTLFRNPLASPSILGTTAGATLGAHLALLGSVLVLGGGGAFGVAPEMLIPLGAMLGAGLSLAVLLAVVSLREDPLVLLLTGFAVMSIFQGASLFLGSLNQHAWELNRAFSQLVQGDISAAGPRQLLMLSVMTLGGVLPLVLSASTLDVLLSGEEEARTLGVEVKQVRSWLVVWVAMLSAGAVAVGGSVGFVGLIVPHALRPLFGERHALLLPAVLLGGGAFVIVCDVLCRVLPVQNGIPLGVLTDLIGAPVFLRLLLLQLRRQAAHG